MKHVLAAITACALGAGIPLVHLASNLEVALILAIIAVAAAPVVRRLVAGSFDLFEPIVGATVMLLVLFGIRPILMIANDERTHHTGFSVEQFFTQTLTMSLLAVASFVVAYEVTSSLPIRARETSPRPVRQRMVYRFAIIGAALGAALFMLHLSRAGTVVGSIQLLVQGESNVSAERYGGSSEYLSILGPVLVASSAIVLLATSDGKRSFLVWLGIATAIVLPVVIFALAGTRRFILPTLAIPLVAYYLLAQRRPRARSLLLIAPVAFLVLATIPFARTQGARTQAGGTSPIYERAFHNPGDTIDRFLTGPDTDMIVSLGVEVAVLDRPGDFSFGRATLGDLALAPIPHLLVPNKPTTARDEMLTQAFGTPCEAFGGLCPDFSVVGTFYQDLWYPGIMIGMVLLGIFSASTWRRYLASPRDPRSIVVAASWTLFLPILIRAGFMPAFAWFLYFLVPTLAIIWLARQVRPGPAAIGARTAQPQLPHFGLSQGDRR